MDVQCAHVLPGAGKIQWVLGSFIVYKVRGGNEQNTTFEEIVPAQMSGPRHFHYDQDEAFYILEGQYTFHVGADSIEAGPGSFIYVPRGTVHSVKNTGTTPGKALVTITPGPLVHFFDEVGVPVHDMASFQAPSGPPDMEKVGGSARRHRIELVGA